jgi:hypothetical protein
MVKEERKGVRRPRYPGVDGKKEPRETLVVGGGGSLSRGAEEFANPQDEGVGGIS